MRVWGAWSSLTSKTLPGKSTFESNLRHKATSLPLPLLTVLTGGRGTPRALSPSPRCGCLASRCPYIPHSFSPSQWPRAGRDRRPSSGDHALSSPPSPTPEGSTVNSRISEGLSYSVAHQGGKTGRCMLRHSRPLPLTMSVTLRPPNEKAMALGGVATGSMKARELARVQGSMT